VSYVGEWCTNDQKRKKISDALQQPDLPTKTQCQIVWGPAEHASNYALWYVAAGEDGGCD